MIELELKQWGNSIGVILPAEKLREFSLVKGDKVEIEIIGKKKIDAFGICKGAKTFERDHDDREEFA